jgi:hypothetical protein
MRTSARVVWIANLEPDPLDASNLTAIEHLLVLRMHGVRVDAVLHDESATLKFDPAELAGNGAESMSRALCSRTDPALHEPEQLRMALSPMLSLRPASAVGS